MDRKHKLKAIIIICLSIITFSLSANIANASDGWIGSGSTSGGSGGGGGGGGSSCSATDNKFRIDCAGASWIFYRATKETKNSTDFPHINPSVDASIPAECSQHGGGFWHYGLNNFGLALGMGPFAWDYVFYGHWKTLNWGYAPWDSTPLHTNYYKTGSNSNLTGSDGQVVGVYKAEKYGSESTVFNQYKQAYKAKNGKDYSGTSLPDGVYAFCYWEGMADVTLTLKAVDTSGTAMSGISDKTAGGAPNTDHTVTAATAPTGYTFKGIKSTKTASSYLSTGNRTYKEKISTNTTRYAVYAKDSTLKLKAVDTSGTAMSGMSDKTDSGDPDTNRSVTADDAPTGYTFKGIKSTATASTYLTTGKTRSEKVDSGSTVTRYAIYEKNTFQGKASVSGYGSVSATTGWKSSTDSKSTEMECLNAGCDATFTLSLKTTAGEGKTNYSAQKKIGSGSWTNVTVTPVSPSKPSSSGTNVVTATETLSPGQTVCYKLSFKPETISGTTAVDETVCITAKASTFEGKTSVSGTNGGTNSTNWQKTNNSQIATISNCSPTSGCQVSFTHQMKRTSGIGSSSWTVARTSNLTSKVSSTTVGSGTFSPSSNNTGDTVQTDSNLTLYPGMVVCETLTFYPNNTSSTTASTKVCVHALGNAQPSDTALLDIKVKNNNVNKYNTYTDAVYAKPGDSLTYQTTYNPILQYTYNLKPQKMRIDSGTTYPTSSANTSSSLGSLFNANHGSSLKNWNNAFSVQRTTNSNWSSANLIEAGVNGYTYTAGSTTTRTKDNNVSVAASYVGKSIDERAITNLNDTTKTTPKQVTFTEVSGNNTANVVTTQVSSIAHAYVPYNFTNTTAVTTNTDTPFYAGEQQTVSFTITTNPRCNNYTTNDTCTGSSDTHKYATKVDGAKWKLAVKVGSGAWQYTDPDTHSSSDTGTLNSGNTSTGSTATKNLSIIVPDVAAGTQICVKSMVYPANSGGATNWSDKEGSHTWAESAQRCFTVAKRPNLQVLGGNVYSNGQIVTSTSVKQHLSGYTTHVLDARDSNNNNYVFGSWGELGVISGGPVTGFASGATLGYSLGSLEAKAQTNYCNRIPLTIANAKNNDGSCLGNTVGALGNSSSNNNITDSKNDLFAKYVNTEDAPNDLSVAAENNIDSLKVYYARSSVTITGNLYYKNSGHTTLESLPKVLIFSNGEIKINCDVTHIDGVLVANKVTTCADSDDINAAKNSTQLTVNGAIITSNLVANRTYGAATGVNSIAPAEIINFDPSLYRWESGSSTAEATTNASASLITTYQKELAPRY